MDMVMEKMNKKKKIKPDVSEWVLICYMLFLCCVAMWVQSLFMEAATEAYNEADGDYWWVYCLSSRGFSVLLSAACALVGVGFLCLGLILPLCFYNMVLFFFFFKDDDDDDVDEEAADNDLKTVLIKEEESGQKNNSSLLSQSGHCSCSCKERQDPMRSNYCLCFMV